MLKLADKQQPPTLSMCVLGKAELTRQQLVGWGRFTHVVQPCIWFKEDPSQKAQELCSEDLCHHLMAWPRYHDGQTNDQACLPTHPTCLADYDELTDGEFCRQVRDCMMK